MTRMTFPTDWAASGRINADVDTAVLITNTQGQAGFFAVTSSDTPPDIAVGEGHKIWPAHVIGGSQVALTLRAGERLWLATGPAAADFTVTQGPA